MLLLKRLHKQKIIIISLFLKKRMKVDKENNIDHVLLDVYLHLIYMVFCLILKSEFVINYDYNLFH